MSYYTLIHRVSAAATQVHRDRELISGASQLAAQAFAELCVGALLEQHAGPNPDPEPNNGDRSNGAYPV